MLGTRQGLTHFQREQARRGVARMAAYFTPVLSSSDPGQDPDRVGKSPVKISQHLLHFCYTSNILRQHD